MASMLDQAAESLDREAGGNFFKLDGLSKLTVMESLAQAPFFEYIRLQVRLRLYSHRQSGKRQATRVYRQSMAGMLIVDLMTSIG